jgi:protein-tyrosine kinase
MSRIFDALKNADLDGGTRLQPVQDEFCSTGLQPVQSALDDESCGAGLQPVQPVHDEFSPADLPPVDSVHPAVPPRRSVSLHISTLAPILPFTDGHHITVEQYRIVRTKILHHPSQPRMIVISSPTTGDGKTVTAINTAAALALKKDVRVLLVDADLRRTDISRVLGIPASPGLGDVLSGRSTLADAIVRLEEFPSLCVLPAGPSVKNSAELLDSPHWDKLAEALRAQFTYTIVDATPIAAVADFELVQRVCDGVILVMRPDHSERKLCFKAIEAIPKEKFLGAVLNCVEDWFLWKTHGYMYYGGKQ